MRLCLIKTCSILNPETLQHPSVTLCNFFITLMVRKYFIFSNPSNVHYKLKLFLVGKEGKIGSRWLSFVVQKHFRASKES